MHAQYHYVLESRRTMYTLKSNIIEITMHNAHVVIEHT